MSLISRMLKQTAVYWAPSTPNANGQPTYATPVELAVRWEDKVEEFLDAEGEVERSQALVYVASDVLVGGILMLGEISSSTVEDDPKANEGAWEIKRFEKLPNLRVTEFLRTAYL